MAISLYYSALSWLQLVVVRIHRGVAYASTFEGLLSVLPFLLFCPVVFLIPLTSCPLLLFLVVNI